jgi:hypothetical protein
MKARTILLGLMPLPLLFAIAIPARPQAGVRTQSPQAGLKQAEDDQLQPFVGTWCPYSNKLQLYVCDPGLIWTISLEGGGLKIVSDNKSYRFTDIRVSGRSITFTEVIPYSDSNFDVTNYYDLTLSADGLELTGTHRSHQIKDYGPFHDTLKRK